MLAAGSPPAGFTIYDLRFNMGQSHQGLRCDDQAPSEPALGGRSRARQAFALEQGRRPKHARRANLKPIGWCGQGSDATANLLARVFGCGALVRGGAVQEAAAAGAVATMLLDAAARKTFLREVAAEVLLEMAGGLPSLTASQQCVSLRLHVQPPVAPTDAAAWILPVLPQARCRLRSNWHVPYEVARAGGADLLDRESVLQEVLHTNEALRALLQQKADAATPEVLPADHRSRHCLRASISG